MGHTTHVKIDSDSNGLIKP